MYMVTCMVIKVLARVGRKLKEVVGEDGVVGRIGGDEFVIIFNGINDEHELRGCFVR